MKVLIVCSGNAPGFKFEIHQAFIYDQVVAILKNYPEINFEYFFIHGNGIKGYLSNLKRLKKQIKEQKFDLIHAHFALSGLFANLQRKIPVVCTFHGSDINQLKNRIVATFVELLSRKTIYVSQNLYKKAFFKRGKSIIPCGVDFEIFKPVNKELARQRMNLNSSKQYILFSSSFSNKVKNYKLLKESCDLLKNRDVEIIELKGYSREEVALLMNAADICAMTSYNEGSPQFIKEAMACNCPIVSTDVGDVRWQFGNVPGHFFTYFTLNDVAEKLNAALTFSETQGKTNGRQRIKDIGLDSETVSQRIVTVYRSAIKKEKNGQDNHH